ncbi:hypothetical protein SAMN02745121_01103 [Nannocystis exedens]|uniref:Uncharacterized protein n=1 Tax=Nannocystis exedens TaxID=54 RepID=A0A1I1UAS4_9BACT|nr:hypothetical protein [Nannocystis exedens]PCC71558.1 hypothetical protein NAEX_04635 [Nannocystis exedens]SFD67869.1 hypothetical protein SAMN02745121_01103 [Nannocystis exedens]
MTTPRSSPTTNAGAWQALRDYLIDAYSNQEMRTLVELTLLAEAGTRLPDERVPAHEYAATLCMLIQRHSGCPVPEFWRQLLADRPWRRPEIDKLQTIFDAAMAASGRPPPQPPRPVRRWQFTVPPLLGAALITALGAAGTYCALARDKPKIECNDGTRSPTCTELGPGCCSRHGGVKAVESK